MTQKLPNMSPLKTQEYLQLPSSVPTTLSSNSSLNSSSVKSVASKSDAISTEKKRKILSSSRQKKFHRRFKQVADDEEVINCMYIHYGKYRCFIH